MRELERHDYGVVQENWTAAGRDGSATVDWERWRALETANRCAVLACWEDRNDAIGTELVGYSVVSTIDSAIDTARIGVVVAIYLAPNMRRGGGGARLMDLTAQLAHSMGCTVLQWTAPNGKALSRILARRRGCRLTETIYEEVLQ